MNFFDQDTTDEQVAYEQLLVDIYDALCAREGELEAKGISRAELARRMGKDRSVVTRLLNGKSNLTLQTFASLATALECRVDLTLQPFEKVSNVNVTVDPVRSKSPWSSNQRITIFGDNHDTAAACK